MNIIYKSYTNVDIILFGGENTLNEVKFIYIK